MKNNDILEYDVLIIGAGPAGLTCAIYSSRGNLSVAFIDKGAPGGKMTKTFRIENWSGDENVKGYELSQRMLNHAKKLGAHHIFGTVLKIESKAEFEHYVHLSNGKIFKSKSIVIASGMENKVPNIKNFEKYENKGVSFCVICDGSFYKDKPAAIIGGGDSAFEEAIYLSSIASVVYIFVRKAQAKAENVLVNEVSKISNIKVFYNSEVIELLGENNLEKIKYQKDGKEDTLEINHLYPYIGFVPSVDFATHLDIFDEVGFIKTDEDMQTKTPGVYAIGDVRRKKIRQIVTAASDGAIVGKNLTNKIKK